MKDSSSSQIILKSIQREYRTVFWSRDPGGTPHMKGVAMLIGNFELNP